MEPCAWCLRPTDAWADAPGLGPTATLPLHPLPCGAVILRAYRRWLAGLPARTVDEQRHAKRLWGARPPLQLGAGTTP